MSQDACPLPTPPSSDEALVIQRLLTMQRIAIVGLSDNPARASHGVASYLQGVGKTIIPVNPKIEMVLGLQCYPSLQAVPGPIDVVDVFRRAEYCAEVTRKAIAAGANGVWLQTGIVSEEAQRLARAAGIDFIQNRCMMVEHLHQQRGR